MVLCIVTDSGRRLITSIATMPRWKRLPPATLPQASLSRHLFSCFLFPLSLFLFLGLNDFLSVYTALRCTLCECRFWYIAEYKELLDVIKTVGPDNKTMPEIHIMIPCVLRAPCFVILRASHGRRAP